MRTEGLFFKTLFFVFASFYIVSYFIFLILVICIKIREYSTTNFIESMKIMAFAPFLLGFIATIFFSPVLLLICFIRWGIMNKWLKNVISFILMIVYGFCLIFIIFSDSYNKPWNHPLFEISDYFLLSVPATLIFLIILFYLTKRSIRP